MPRAPRTSFVARSTRLDIQSLEDRRMLAAFGNPWPDAHNLAVSFPADGVAIGEHENELNALLDQVASREQWQELVLRAYQTWAIHADINIGLQDDLDLDFGVPGLQVNDPRFGEFRIGAFPQLNTLANSVPFQAIAGTYSGDLILNSDEQFSFHSWEGGLGPVEPLAPDQHDLFSLLLHEVGNTLGIEDSDNEWSVMFGQYTGPKGVLTAEDIEAITTIYGERSDPYETVANDVIESSTPAPAPALIDSTLNTSQYRGSIRSGTDVDHYKIAVPDGIDVVGIRLRAAGISLLESRLEVLGATGDVIWSNESDSVFDNNNRLIIPMISDIDELLIRVSAKDPSGPYAVGDYQLEVSSIGGHESPYTLMQDVWDVLRDAEIVDPELFDREIGENDSIADAAPMNETSDTTGERYEIRSSVASAEDVDYFKITAPETVSGRLIVHLAGASTDNPELRLRVVDSSGNPVGTAGRVRADGTLSVEVTRPQASEDYFVRVSVDPLSAVGEGDYVAVAEFEGVSTQMHSLQAGTVSGTEDEFFRWTANKSKLFRFNLTALGTTNDQGARLTIYDAHTRDIKASFVTHSGVTRGLFAWLDQGEYVLRVSAISYGDSAAGPMQYDVSCDGLSDDQYDGPDEDEYYYDTGNNYDYEYYEYPEYYDMPTSDYHGSYYYGSGYYYYQ